MARAPRVFIDTNELFPFTVMDTLLTLAEERVITWVWTDELLAEWETVIVREGRRTADAAASVAQAVRRAFGRGRLEAERYLPLQSDALAQVGATSGCPHLADQGECKGVAHSGATWLSRASNPLAQTGANIVLSAALTWRFAAVGANMAPLESGSVQIDVASCRLPRSSWSGVSRSRVAS